MERQAGILQNGIEALTVGRCRMDPREGVGRDHAEREER